MSDKNEKLLLKIYEEVVSGESLYQRPHQRDQGGSRRLQRHLAQQRRWHPDSHGFHPRCPAGYVLRR